MSSEELRQLRRHSNAAAFIGSPTMRPAQQAMPLRTTAAKPAFQWRHEGVNHSIDDYFVRQPVTAVLIAKDGEIVYERYQAGRSAEGRHLSNSMAKSLTALAMGFALREGKVRSLDAPAQAHLPELEGSGYGQTTLRNLLRMGSGVRYSETYRPDDDSTRFRFAASRQGVVRAARAFNDREAPQGSRFNYASVETALVGAAIRSATGEGLARYLEPRLWQAIGAEGEASWQADPYGVEHGQCCLFALPRDYLRLGVVLAHDGRRPDTGVQVVPLDFLLDSTDWRRAEPAFRPGRATPYLGYGNYFWLFPGEPRRFALLGVHGQAIFVDPALRLVMVHLAASAAARVGETSMAAERTALFRGVVQHYGRW